MAITLEELVALRGDKQTLARIDDLVDRRAKKHEAIEKVYAEIEAIEAELAEIGILVDPPELAPAPQKARRGRPPKNRGNRSAAEPVGLQRSAEEYHDSLDAVGQIFLNDARSNITGPDIVTEMAALGFPSRQMIMKHLKSHPRWRATGIRRSTRYHYSTDKQKRTRK